MKYFLPIIAVAWLAGCSLPNDTVDTPTPPFLTFATSSLTVIDVGRLTSTVDTTIVVSATARSTNISAVTAVIIAPDGSSAVYALLDNGIAPDQQKNDGIFTGKVPLSLSKSAVGAYSIQIQASDGSELSSNMLSLPVTVISSNNQPPFISQLAVPDTLTVPTGETPNYYRLSVFVSDPDGLGSIESVSFTSFRSDGGNAGIFTLLDDGGKTTTPSSGDDVAGDGRYTITIMLPRGSTPGPYRDFVFTAKDKSGAISNSLTKRVYFK